MRTNLHHLLEESAAARPEAPALTWKDTTVSYGELWQTCEAAAGGLAAIRGAIIDDCALGRLLKRQGGVRLRMSGQALSVRPYPAFGDIRRMVVRSAYAELRYRPERLATALLGLALVFLVPPLAMLAGPGLAARGAGALAFALMAASFVPMLRFYGLNPMRALLLPIVAALYAGFTAESAVQYARGRGGAWKGRIQAPRREAAS